MPQTFFVTLMVKNGDTKIKGMPALSGFAGHFSLY